MSNETEFLQRRYEREKLARQQAEQIAEDKSRELYLKSRELEQSIEAERKAKLEIESLLKEVERLSNIDYLTGLNNRRYFNDVAQRLFKLAVRRGQPISALMLDLDHFKKVNDTYGHAIGDQVLTEVAGTLRKIIRSTDLQVRYGGEEFCVLLPDTDFKAAHKLAERILEEIASLKFSADGRHFFVTVSVGVAEYLEDKDSLESLLKRSDQALYEAKRTGRNRIV